MLLIVAFVSQGAEVRFGDMLFFLNVQFTVADILTYCSVLSWLKLVQTPTILFFKKG